MNVFKRHPSWVVGIGAATLALLPAFATAGDLTGTNTILGNFSSANGYYNWVTGGQAFASGQQNNVGGNFNSAFGYGHVVDGNGHLVFGTQHGVGGGGNAVFGYQNQTGASSLYNFLTGSFNAADGANAWIGGSNNVSSGNRSLLFGRFLDDNGLAGTVIFSDNNPFSIRSTSAPFTPANQDSLSGIFDGGYALHTNSGQGANPDAGLYIVPSAANTAATSSPAFVGINNPAPTAALDVAGNAVVNGNSVVVGQETLRTLRGRVSTGGAVQNGSGFTSLRVGVGHYRITFNTAFSSVPTPVATAFDTSERQSMTVSQVSTTQFEVRSWNNAGAAVDTDWFFIVTGPRP